MLKEIFKAVLSGLLLIVVIKSIAQPGPNYKILRDDYSSMVNTTIGSIEKSKNGLIWLQGFGAIASFDGKNFKHFAPPDERKGALIGWYESPKGEIIVQDQHGQLFYLNGEQFSPHPANDTIAAINRRGKMYWTAIDSHYIHLAIPNRIYLKIDSSGNITYPLEEKNVFINGLAIILRPGKDPIMINKRDQSIGKDIPRQVRLFDEEFNLLDSMFFSTSIPYFPKEYTQLSNGNYLISALGILFECNEREIIRKIEYPKRITGLLADSRAGLWISSNEGLDYYPDQIIDTTSKISIIDNQFCVVRQEDYQGGIWAHANQLGAIHIPYPQYSHFSDQNYLSSTGVRTVQLYHDTLFYSTSDYDYLFYIDQNSMDTGRFELPMRKGERFGIIDQCAIENEYKLWVSERGNLYYREKGKWKTISTEKLEETNYFSKYYLQSSKHEDYDFVGFHHKQYFLGNEDSIEYISQPFPEQILSVLLVGDSTFIGTINGLYLKKKDSLIKLHEHYTSLTGAIGELTYFDGKVWIAANKSGLLMLTPDSLQKAIWNGEQIHSGVTIMVENETYLWAVGNNYSFRYERGKTFEYFPYIPAFSDGNQSTPYHKGSIYALNARKGILKMDFDDIANGKLPLPLVYFDEIKFDTTIASLDDTVYTLPYTNNSIRISYAGINFLDLPIDYRYRLGDNNELWETTDGDDLFLIGLSPGEYHFELQTRIGLQDWTSSKKLTFIITPPVWKTAWFITAVAFLVTVIILFLVWLRIEQIRRRNDLIVQNLLSEQKTLRAKLDPHFVFNIIGSAQSLILREHKEKAVHFLQLFSKQLRSVLDQSDKNTYTISDEIKMLKEYIDLEFYRSGESFQYTIHVEDNIELDEEKILPLIVQPFVENAILHGFRSMKEKGELNIDFNIQGEFLKITIQDNGIGRKAAKELRTEAKIKQQSHGIKICKERLALHNKNASDEAVHYEDLSTDGNANGTRVTISMKRIKIQ